MEGVSSSVTSEATLQLCILSVDLNKPKPSSSSSSSQFLVAWIDPYPSLKSYTQTLKTLTPLHLPLPSSALSNPSSALTIHLLSPRLPFRRPKLVGAASLPLSSLRLSGNVLTLPLLKLSHSDRPRGTIRFALRILWCLDATPPRNFTGTAGPSAPPQPKEFNGGDGSESVEDSSVMPDSVSMDLGSGAPMLEEDESLYSRDCSVDDCKEGNRGFDDSPFDQIVEEKAEEKGAWRSFLVGLVSGTLATVLVGVASLSEG